MNIRPSPIAGSWYPGRPEMLAREVDRCLDAPEIQAPGGRVWGVVAPHAGYRYSGGVAGCAFKCLRGLHPDLVAVVSPFHASHRAPLLTTAHAAYETPLGPVEVDSLAVKELDEALRRRAGFGLTPVSRDSEHSLEIELPFLQRVLGPFRLLPVMVVEQSVPVVEALGDALAGILRGKEALLVASSDLSHFYPQAAARRLDREILRRIGAFDPMAVMNAEEEGAGFACGRGAIAAVLRAAKNLGADRVSVLRHATSGDATGDTDSVVGYGAAVLWQAAGRDPARVRASGDSTTPPSGATGPG